MCAYSHREKIHIYLFSLVWEAKKSHTQKKCWLSFLWQLTFLFLWEQDEEGRGCVINLVLLCQRGDSIAMLKVLGAYSHSSVVSLQCVFHFFFCWAHLQSQTVSSCRFPFVPLISMFSFFPLEIILVTTHLTSGFLSSFLDFFQPLFSAVSLSWYHLKVNEADLLPGENTVWTFYTLWLMTILFQCLWPISVSGVVSCSGFSLVMLIKIIVLAFEYLTYSETFCDSLLLFILLLYCNGIGDGLCVLVCAGGMKG